MVSSVRLVEDICLRNHPGVCDLNFGKIQKSCSGVFIMKKHGEKGRVGHL